jgi:hypothetical protein
MPSPWQFIMDARVKPAHDAECAANFFPPPTIDIASEQTGESDHRIHRLRHRIRT